MFEVEVDCLFITTEYKKVRGSRSLICLKLPTHNSHSHSLYVHEPQNVNCKVEQRMGVTLRNETRRQKEKKKKILISLAVVHYHVSLC